MTEQEINLLQRMSDANISFMAPGFMRGEAFLSVEEVEEYLNDREAYFARRYGVSVEKLRYVETYHTDPQCIIKTKNGKPCQGYIDYFHGEPSEFIEGFHDVCRVHRKRGSSALARTRSGQLRQIPPA